MEILMIHATTDLRVRPTTERPAGTYLYPVNCYQFSTAQRAWLKERAPRSETIVVMTLDFERIWMTPDEGQQVADAIKGMAPQVTLKNAPPDAAPAGSDAVA